MELDQLPDDCLTALFRQCHLQDLLILRAVCSRWQILVERMCEQKRSLKLFGSNGTFKRDLNRILFKRMCFNLNIYEDAKLANVTDNDNDDLVICAEDKFNKALIDFLICLCPKIEVLIICGFTQPLSSYLVYLIRKLPNLKSLYLQGRLQSRTSELNIKICDAINSLNSLQNLSFRLSDFCMKNVHHELLFRLTPTLSRIEQFAIQHRGCEGDIISVLSQLGPNCSRLSLECERLSVEQINTQLLVNIPDLRTRLTHLRLVAVKLEYFKFACETFSSLQHLDISLGLGLEYFKINSDLINNLSHLQSLTELRINPMILNKDEDFQLDDLSRTFPTVKRLSITLQTRPMGVRVNFNYDLLFEILPMFFPGLQYIEICNYDDPIPSLKQKLGSFFSLQACQFNYKNFSLV